MIGSIEELEKEIEQFHKNVAASGELVALLDNPGLIRNRSKIYSVRKNARAVQNIQEEYGSFDAYLWRFTDGAVVDGRWERIEQMPTESDISRICGTVRRYSSPI